MARFLRSRYLRALRWPVRIVAWLVCAGLASVAGWKYAVLGPVGFEFLFLIMFLITMLADARRLRGLPGPVALDKHSPLAQQVMSEAGRLAALPRVASPGGWGVPAGARPAWDWTPPPGIEPRLDRAPVWVRLWYGTPLVDRYAHAWLWYHGGWDVIPPGAWHQ